MPLRQQRKTAMYARDRGKAVDAKAPAGRIDDPANDVDRRRLAGTVRAEEGEDLAAAGLRGPR
jgi:hypothetical protein